MLLLLVEEWYMAKWVGEIYIYIEREREMIIIDIQ